MSALNAEQRKYIDGKMNTFLSMEDFKYTKRGVSEMVSSHFVGKAMKVKPKYAGFRYGSYGEKQVQISFEYMYVSTPKKILEICKTIDREQKRRSEIVKSIREKMVFGAQADEIKQLLAMLK